MIPSLLLVGLMVGALPRPWFWYGLVMAAMTWTLLIAFSGPDVQIDPAGEAFTFLLAAANTGVGIVVARFLVNLVVAVANWRR